MKKFNKRLKKSYKKLSKKFSKQLSKHLRRFRRHKHRTRYAILSLVVLVTAVFAVGGYFYAHTADPGRLVTFHDRGQDHVILTRADSVRQALQDANIAVAPQDIVEPEINSHLLSTDSAVIIYRSRPVLIIDGAERQKVVTAAAAPNEILAAAGLPALSTVDKATLTEGNVINDGAIKVLTVERTVVTPNTVPALAQPKPNALSKSKGAQLFTDSFGVAHRETYYDLPMNIVIGHCSDTDYTVRADGAKIDKDGYILVAANYRIYPKCSIVETSMGLGKVYDTGGFALRYPHGFDIATDWTNYNGR